MLHRLFLSQKKTSGIQNRVTSWYESELTGTLSGTTVKGCELQDTSGSKTPGSGTPSRVHGHISSYGRGLRCFQSPGLVAAEHKAPDRHGVCAPPLLLSPCTTGMAGEGEERSSGKDFLGPEASKSAKARGFCAVISFFAARSAGGRSSAGRSYIGNISPCFTLIPSSCPSYAGLEQ